MGKQDSHYIEHAEPNGIAAKKLPFRQRTKRHCGRFWWLYVLIFIIVVLVVVLPIIYVGFPRLAQREVNESIISVTSMSILEPAPDSFELDLTQVLYTDSKYHPELDAFNGSLYLEGSDVAFAVIEVPAMKAENGTVGRVQQHVIIADQDQFTEFTTTVLHNEELTLVLKGSGGLTQGILPKTTVDYDKRISMKGFNRLSGLSILEFNLMEESLPDGSNSNGTVFIPNPTVMTLALGTVSLAMFVDGVSVGTSTLPDLVLVPGDNRVPMFAIANQTAVVGLIQDPQYDPSALPITIIGNSSVYNGEVLPYYSKALQANELLTPLNVTKTLIDAGFGFVLTNTTAES